jgi:hypothetical protein
MNNLNIEIDDGAVREAIANALEKVVSEAATGYPIAIEHDGSRWISLDWLVEKLQEPAK